MSLQFPEHLEYYFYIWWTFFFIRCWVNNINGFEWLIYTPNLLCLFVSNFQWIYLLPYLHFIICWGLANNNSLAYLKHIILIYIVNHMPHYQYFNNIPSFCRPMCSFSETSCIFFWRNYSLIPTNLVATGACQKCSP